MAEAGRRSPRHRPGPHGPHYTGGRRILKTFHRTISPIDKDKDKDKHKHKDKDIKTNTQTTLVAGGYLKHSTARSHPLTKTKTKTKTKTNTSTKTKTRRQTNTLHWWQEDT